MPWRPDAVFRVRDSVGFCCAFFFGQKRRGGAATRLRHTPPPPFRVHKKRGDAMSQHERRAFLSPSLSRYTKKRSFSFFAKSKRVTKGSSVVIVNITALPPDKNQETWAKREDLYTLGRESDPTQPFRKNNCSRSAERGTESQHHANIR